MPGSSEPEVQKLGRKYLIDLAPVGRCFYAGSQGIYSDDPAQAVHGSKLSVNGQSYLREMLTLPGVLFVDIHARHIYAGLALVVAADDLDRLERLLQSIVASDAVDEAQAAA